MAAVRADGISFQKLKWWGQRSVVNTGGRTQDRTENVAAAANADALLRGDVRPPDPGVADSDFQVKIVGRLDPAPSFNAEENEGRLQRVLEVATNNLLSEKARRRLLVGPWRDSFRS